MNQRLNFTVPGPPGHQPRARAVAFQGRARVYDPKQAVEWKSLVKHCAAEAVTAQGFGLPPDAPIMLCITAIYPRKHFPKKAGPGRQPKPSKPDWDNIGKAISDALNGIAYKDDALIVVATVAKVYAAENEAPSTHVLVRPAFATWATMPGSVLP